MTDEELDRLTAPTRYTYLAGAGIMRVGLTVAEVEKPVKAHRCGNCNWQGRGREDCRNNKEGAHE